MHPVAATHRHDDGLRIEIGYLVEFLQTLLIAT